MQHTSRKTLIGNASYVENKNSQINKLFQFIKQNDFISKINFATQEN